MAETIFKIPKLKGSSNYDLWSIRIEAILVEKGYTYITTKRASQTSPEEARDLENKEKAIALIKLSLENSLLL